MLLLSFSAWSSIRGENLPTSHPHSPFSIVDRHSCGIDCSIPQIQSYGLYFPTHFQVTLFAGLENRVCIEPNQPVFLFVRRLRIGIGFVKTSKVSAFTL